MKLTEEEYFNYCESFDGYCTKCDDITRLGETEPDAEHYECPECEEKSCCGVEQALLLGHLDITD